MNGPRKFVVPAELVEFVDKQIRKLDSVRGLSSQEDLIRRQAALAAYEEVRKRLTEG